MARRRQTLGHGSKSCKQSGKITFRTQFDAMAKASLSEAWYGTPMKVYRCPHCRKWHTSREQSE